MLLKAVFWRNRKTGRYHENVTHEKKILGERVVYNLNNEYERLLYIQNRLYIDGETLPEINKIVEKKDNITYYFEPDKNNRTTGYGGCDWCDMIYTSHN